MKTAFVHDFADGFAPLLGWLQEGETVVLLTDDGRPLGRFVPEASAAASPIVAEQERFARRFAPLASVPARDLSVTGRDTAGRAAGRRGVLRHCWLASASGSCPRMQRTRNAAFTPFTDHPCVVFAPARRPHAEAA